MPSWLFGSLRHYDRAWLRGDLIAGLTVWAVLVPEALAYASIAGVSPVVGLYAAPGALLLYRLALGSSRHLVTGPMSATAALSAATVGELVAQGDRGFAATTAALAVTTWHPRAALLGLLTPRLPWRASSPSRCSRASSSGCRSPSSSCQLPEARLGWSAARAIFFEQAWDLVTELGDVDATTLAVGLLSLAVVIGGRRLVPGGPVASLRRCWRSACWPSHQALSLDDHDGVADRRRRVHRRRPAVAGDPGRRPAALPGPRWPAPWAFALVGLRARGSARPKTYAAREHYDVDATPRAPGLGAREPGRSADEQRAWSSTAASPRPA